jgi:two-component system, NarL family, response regulator NreC
MKILIADDNQLVRRGIAGLLSREKDMEVCAEASDASETVQKADELRPDLVLLDVSMPGMNGLKIAQLLREKIPALKILIISQYDPELLLPRSLEVGADGCIDKGRMATDLLPTIRNVRQKA